MATLLLTCHGTAGNDFTQSLPIVPNTLLGFDAQGVPVMTTSSGSSSVSLEALGSGADQSLTTSFADLTGLSLDLPSAGIYVVTALISLLGIEVGGVQQYEKFQAQLLDSTNVIEIPGSVREVSVYSLAKGQIHISNRVTALQAITLVVQAKTATTFGGKAVLTESSVNYVKV